ncbi:hypothetical protein PQX77_013433, partial [Marasmius sp. AFHP31]
EYADLAIMDLSKAATPESRQELANQVSDAMHKQRFFYIVNHGYTQSQVPSFVLISFHSMLHRVFPDEPKLSVANWTFDGVNREEKRLFTGKSEPVYEG